MRSPSQNLKRLCRRSLLALGRFELVRSFQFNPLAALVCISIIGWFAFVLFNRIIPIRLSPPFSFTRTRVLILLGIAGILNWVYLLMTRPE